MERYSEQYRQFFNGEFLMGPNSIYLLDELLIKYPLEFHSSHTILDLGCGKGLTSLFLANVTGGSVYANDLWISGEENMQRFTEWGIADRVTPSHEDATKLNFEKEKFDAIVSIDAYHYFAGKEGFFTEKILPFMKKNGVFLAAIPGIRQEFEGRQEELLGDWLGEESYMFRSCARWREIIGDAEDIASVDVREMENFPQAWSTWLAVDNEFAAGDREKFDSIIAKYTCFISIAVSKK